MSALLPPTHDERVRLFGHFDFKPDPKPGNPEHVLILNPWPKQNLTAVHIPQLDKVLGHTSRPVTVHVKAVEPFLALWTEWERQDLLGLIHTFDGAWVARYKRGMSGLAQNLSNHAFGSAFDINASRYPLGKPVAPGDPYRQLVPIANAHGFAWGGDYHSRVDGMHFELAKIPNGR